MTTVPFNPFITYTDANGVPLAGGQIYTYIAGTTTPLASYTDATGTVQASNPIVLDANGRSPYGAIWLSGNYKLALYDVNNVFIQADDAVSATYGIGDMTKAVYDPVNISQQLLGLTAVQSPTNKSFDGTSTVTTPSFNDNSTKLANTQYVNSILQASILASNFAVTSSTAFTTITGFILPIVTGASYTFRAVMNSTSGTSGGVKYIVNGTSGGQASSYLCNSFAYNVATLTKALNTTAPLGSLTEYSATAVSATTLILEGSLTCNASGFIAIQFAQNASNATASTVLAGSFFNLTRVA